MVAFGFRCVLCVSTYARGNTEIRKTTSILFLPIVTTATTNESKMLYVGNLVVMNKDLEVIAFLFSFNCTKINALYRFESTC